MKKEITLIIDVEILNIHILIIMVSSSVGISLSRASAGTIYWATLLSLDGSLGGTSSFVGRFPIWISRGFGIMFIHFLFESLYFILFSKQLLLSFFGDFSDSLGTSTVSCIQWIGSLFKLGSQIDDYTIELSLGRAKLKIILWYFLLWLHSFLLLFLNGLGCRLLLIQLFGLVIFICLGFILTLWSSHHFFWLYWVKFFFLYMDEQVSFLFSIEMVHSFQLCFFRLFDKLLEGGVLVFLVILFEFVFFLKKNSFCFLSMYLLLKNKWKGSFFLYLVWIFWCQKNCFYFTYSYSLYTDSPSFLF